MKMNMKIKKNKPPPKKYDRQNNKNVQTSTDEFRVKT